MNAIRVGTYYTTETGGWFRGDENIAGYIEDMVDGWWISEESNFTLSIYANPSQGRLPFVSIVSAISSTPLETLQWYINGVLQPVSSTKIRVTLIKSGIYVISLVATDIYGGGPLTATTTILVISTVSVIDSAILSPDPNRIMALEGIANITHVPKGGVGVNASVVSNFVSTGFSHGEGPNLIFS